MLDIHRFPEAIESIYPEAEIQISIVHLIRYSTQFACWKERERVAKALKPVYQADTPIRPHSGWRSSMPANGAKNIRRLLRRGAANESR